MVNQNSNEKSEAKRMGAKLGFNSGRGYIKGDAFWKNFTIDYKHVTKSFTLNQEVWSKACTDAMKNRNDPMIIVILGEGQKKIRLAITELELIEDRWNENE